MRKRHGGHRREMAEKHLRGESAELGQNQKSRLQPSRRKARTFQPGSFAPKRLSRFPKAPLEPGPPRAAGVDCGRRELYLRDDCGVKAVGCFRDVVAAANAGEHFVQSGEDLVHGTNNGGGVVLSEEFG